MSRKHILVIGAGATGMTAAKACLEQGLDVSVYEKTNYTGGLWRYQDSIDVDGIASVMRSTIINSSKELTAFSDFPPPKEYPNYMHNTKMVSYFDLYGASFNFVDHVHFRHEVLSVQPADDHASTGRWKVVARRLDDGEHVERVYDGVMVCTGHHGTVNMPTFPGQDKFRGKVMHTHSLKHAQAFQHKRVVVVGIGNSGGDAAVEISQVAQQVYLSTRRGSWIANRVDEKGLPSDIRFAQRFSTMVMSALPYDWINSYIEGQLNKRFDHEAYQLKPKHRFQAQHIMVNDALPNRILSGTVIIKSDIDRFTEKGVVFVGETEETECDVVILATGYKITFPFLSADILPLAANKIALYKHEFIHTLPHAHTLAFISLVQPIGAILPIGELQSRWFALLMTGERKLPSVKTMARDIELKKSSNAKRYYESERHTVQVDWLPFMDEIAEQVGCRPPVWRYLFTDLPLFKAIMFGPSCSYQYRLVGPHAWSGAREAMVTSFDRVYAALQTKSKPCEDKLVNNNKQDCSLCVLPLFVLACVVFIADLWFDLLRV